ncbi:unnamed protein product [Linum tenue]|uniref:DUF4378 domain-containing protein n=1 Tax=Linum tenue TaxID=586396 RepID=A0AAV0PMS6_9ROSI|nr:unnamed protein product [Linum tenue]
MGKSTQRLSHARCEKSGCMWSLISMLDFRYGRFSQKMLLDRRYASRPRAAGAEKQKFMHDTDIDEHDQDGEENVVVTRRPSVKELIEEDLLDEQLSVSETISGEMELILKGKRRSDTKRTSLRKGCEVHGEAHVACTAAELTCPHNSEAFMYDGEIGKKRIEEFNHQKSSSRRLRKDQGSELHHQLSQRINDDFEGKLKEIKQLLVSQKVKHRKHQEEDDSIDQSQALKDALQIICSDEELLLKVLQGQGNLQVANGEESKSPVGTSVAEQRQCVSKQANEVSATKHGKHFRRKSKYLERTISKGNVSHQDTNRIVILKPGQKGLQDSETKKGLGSSPQLEMSVRNKEGNGKNRSHFSLTEIKRRLKTAMGRERQDGSTISNRHPNEPTWAGKEGDRRRLNESSSGRRGPNKEHFFMERIARYPTSSRKGENGANSIEFDKGKEQEVNNILPKSRTSNIYLEAKKKHLSEILTDGPTGEAFPSEPNPKPLGRILSSPEYNSSSCGSSGGDLWYGFIPARMSLPNIEKFQRLESQIGRISLSSELSDDIISDNKGQIPCDPSSSFPKEHVRDGKEKNANEVTAQGGLEIEKVTEIIMSSEDINFIGYLSETSSCYDAINNQNVGTCNAREERGDTDIFEHDCSPPTSIGKICQALEPKEIQGRPSPVSVLEPLYTDDEVSPAATRSQSVLQPLRIQFEEVDSLHGDDEEIHLKNGTEETDCIFEFIRSVLLASGINWEELYLMSDSLDQILDPSSCEEFQFFPNQLCSEKQLLFDCTDEALVQVYERYFSCSPGFSLAMPSIRPVPDMENTIHEVWEIVHCHLMPLPLPHILEMLVKKGMDTDSSWMELRRDTQTVIDEIGEAIFEDLIDGTILSCVNKVGREGQ